MEHPVLQVALRQQHVQDQRRAAQQVRVESGAHRRDGQFQVRLSLPVVVADGRVGLGPRRVTPLRVARLRRSLDRLRFGALLEQPQPQSEDDAAKGGLRRNRRQRTHLRQIRRKRHGANPQTYQESETAQQARLEQSDRVLLSTRFSAAIDARLRQRRARVGSEFATSRLRSAMFPAKMANRFEFASQRANADESDEEEESRIQSAFDVFNGASRVQRAFDVFNGARRVQRAFDVFHGARRVQRAFDVFNGARRLRVQSEDGDGYQEGRRSDVDEGTRPTAEEIQPDEDEEHETEPEESTPENRESTNGSGN